MKVIMQQDVRLHLLLKKWVVDLRNWQLIQQTDHWSSETYKNCMTTALMNPAPKTYSGTNPLAPSKLYKRIHKFPPIKFHGRHPILSFNNEFSNSIDHKFIHLWCAIAAKWQWCCCVETNPDSRIQQTLIEDHHFLHIQ